MAKTTGTMRNYLEAIRTTLDAALCIQNFPSQRVERHNKPEVELRKSKELLLTPVTISRTDKEEILIEGSVNSIRMSVKIKQMDAMEMWITDRFVRFLEQRAEVFDILRRKSLDGYDISFLITNKHIERKNKEKIIDFLVMFLTDIDAEINEIKLDTSARARVCGRTLLKALV